MEIRGLTYALLYIRMGYCCRIEPNGLAITATPNHQAKTIITHSVVHIDYSMTSCTRGTRKVV